MTNRMRPIHPGEVLRDELEVLGLSANAFAKSLGVPANRITAILKEQRAVTADTALRLARFFGMTPEFWMGLQASYDVKKARESVGRQIEKTVKPGKLGLAA
jgi:addiction module HigA family antidote